MKFLSRLFNKQADPRDALIPLWHAIVAQARQPQWYDQCGVEDSVTGRFDMLTLVTGLVMLRMEGVPAMAEPSARLTECFVADMEDQLREFGVNDVVVGKRVGKLVGLLAGRIDALRVGLASGHPVMDDLVERNVAMTPSGETPKVAEGLIELGARLKALGDEDLLAGHIDEGTAA